MNLTDSIINAALLGTASRELQSADFPDELQNTFHEIQEKATDKEAVFYQMAALGLAFERAGIEPYSFPADAQGTVMPVTEAEEEDTGYFPQEAGELLTSLHQNQNQHLLLAAYRKAAGYDKLIPPAYLQTLIRGAFERNNPNKHKEQYWLSKLTGRRGRWLLTQMELPSWGEADNETWETASHEERKRMLRNLRNEHPEQGLALLQTELKNETAAHREELISCLHTGLSKADEAFLQEVASTDRSTSVKETARQLLCSLPDSELVKTCESLLQGKLHFNILLGWSYDKIAYTPDMKSLGLEEVSTHKQEKDDRFLLRQLAERVPLRFWSAFYNCSPEKAASKLVKNPPFQKLFNLPKVILNFRDSAWAYYTLKENAEEGLAFPLIELLSSAQREEIALRSTGEKEISDNWFNEDGTGWGMKFATTVFRRALQHTYSLPKATVEQLALHFPPEMRKVVGQKIASLPEQEENMASARFCRLLLECMDTKQRIDTLFG